MTINRSFALDPDQEDNERLGLRALNKYGPGGLSSDLNKSRYELKSSIFNLPFSFEAMGTQFAKGGQVKKPMLGMYASGGPIVGPGTGTSDSIPAKVPERNFIIPADIVKKFGREFFDNLVQRFSTGNETSEPVDVMVSNGEYNIPASVVDALGEDFFEKLISEESGEDEGMEADEGMESDMMEKDENIPHLVKGGPPYKQIIEKNTGLDPYRERPSIPSKYLPGEQKGLVPTGQGTTPRVREGVALKEGFFKPQEPYKPNFTLGENTPPSAREPLSIRQTGTSGKSLVPVNDAFKSPTPVEGTLNRANLIEGIRNPKNVNLGNIDLSSTGKQMIPDNPSARWDRANYKAKVQSGIMRTKGFGNANLSGSSAQIDPYTGKPFSNAFGTFPKNAKNFASMLGRGALNAAKGVFDLPLLASTAYEFNNRRLHRSLASDDPDRSIFSDQSPWATGIRAGIDFASNPYQLKGVQSPNDVLERFKPDTERKFEQYGKDAVAPVSQAEIDAYKTRKQAQPAVAAQQAQQPALGLTRPQAAAAQSNNSLLGFIRTTDSNGKVTVVPSFGPSDTTPSDPNVYGPNGVNYGPNPSREQINEALGIITPEAEFKNFLSQRQSLIDQNARAQHQALLDQQAFAPYGDTTQLPALQPAQSYNIDPSLYEGQRLAQAQNIQDSNLGLERDKLRQQDKQFNRTIETKDAEKTQKEKRKSDIGTAISEFSQFSGPIPKRVQDDPVLLDKYNAMANAYYKYIMQNGTDSDRKLLLDLAYKSDYFSRSNNTEGN